MAEYIQVGSTAMRDPATGDFLPAVPLYVRAEDRERCEVPVIDGDALARVFAEKFRLYQKVRREENQRRKKTR